MSQLITKTLSTPVAVNEWESLQREAVRIRMSLVGLIQDMEKWDGSPVNDYKQRYFLIRRQWQTIYTMLFQMIQKNHVRDRSESIEWCKQMREEMNRLAARFLSLEKATGDEKEEPLLDDKNDFSASQ